METIISLLQILSAIDVLGWLPDLTLVEWGQFGVVALVAYLFVGWVLACYLLRGFAFLTHLVKIKKEEGSDNKLPPLLWAMSGREALKVTVVDVVFNFLYGIAILGSVPRLWGKETDWTLSQHMSRYCQTEPKTWRARRVKWLVDNTKINSMDVAHIHPRGENV